MDKETAKELDLVLSHFKGETHEVVIARLLHGKLSHSLRMYLDKLINDGLIEVRVAEKGIYQKTFDGLVFNGYENDLEKKNFTDFLSKTEIWIIAIGTGLAGLYSLIQICQWIYCKCYCQT